MGKLFVSTYTIVKEYDYDHAECKKVEITKAQLDKYAKQLEDYLIKIEYTKTHSYDNSDDERVTDSYSKWDGEKYCEIEPLENSEHLIVKDDTVIGVVFYVRDNRGDETTHVFLFSGALKEEMQMGYSASHSSDWTYVTAVSLVKRGEDGAPMKGLSVNFKQSEMYPSI